MKAGFVTEIDFSVARPFIQQWHYAGDVCKGSHCFFGWYINAKLYAVADFGNGVNPLAVVAIDVGK